MVTLLSVCLINTVSKEVSEVLIHNIFFKIEKAIFP